VQFQGADSDGGNALSVADVPADTTEFRGVDALTPGPCMTSLPNAK